MQKFWKTCILHYEPYIIPIIREIYDETGGDTNKHCLFNIIN